MNIDIDVFNLDLSGECSYRYEKQDVYKQFTREINATRATRARILNSLSASKTENKLGLILKANAASDAIQLLGDLESDYMDKCVR